MPLVVPGFITSCETSTTATGYEGTAVRSLDGRRFALKVIPVTEASHAQVLATHQMAAFDRIDHEHLVRRHSAIALSDGRLALVLDDVQGGSLAHLLGSRGQLTPGETVTTVAPLFRALADLHAAGVVHGDLTPGNILFSAEGRPLIGDLGVADLMGGPPGPFDVTSGFVAPERSAGTAPSPASDVYAMAALGWFCLTGAPPAAVAIRPSLTMFRPDTPVRLAEVLTSCLAGDPAKRPTAGEAAVQVFDSAPAQSVALAPVSDPAAEITRRIRAAAAAVPAPASPGVRKQYRAPLVCGIVALLVAVALGIGATWFSRRPAAALAPAALWSASQSPQGSAATRAAAPLTARPTAPLTTRLTATATRSLVPAASATTRLATQPATGAPPGASLSSTGVATAAGSPRIAAAGLLQSLVDARALAYLARNSALLDLVYAPGAAAADIDRANIASALKNGGTYLGLSFVVQDVAFLNGTSNTARIRATIRTPAYKTGQPDGRKIPHAQEILGPCVFSLSLTTDGWRILSLTAP